MKKSNIIKILADIIESDFHNNDLFVIHNAWCSLNGDKSAKVHNSPIYELTEDNFNSAFEGIKPWDIMSLTHNGSFDIQDKYFCLDNNVLCSYESVYDIATNYMDYAEVWYSNFFTINQHISDYTEAIKDRFAEYIENHGLSYNSKLLNDMKVNELLFAPTISLIKLTKLS